MNRRVYLDHAATTPLVPEAREALVRALEIVGNPNSVHAAGRRARAVLEESRETLAECIGADPAEIVFTSGGTEADNLAILGARSRPGRPHILSAPIEHPAVSEAARFAHVADAQQSLSVTSDGHVSLAGAAATVNSHTALVSVQWVNNEIGTIQPIADVAEVARRNGAWMHSDAAQALGHVPLDFAASGVDLMSLAGHKVGAPVGIGALVVSRRISLAPVSFGGGQERTVRSGTQPVALAAAFAAAASRAAQRQADETRRLAALRDLLVAGVTERVGDVELNGADPVSPAVCNMTFRGLRAADLQFLLDREGFDCSTGSACHAGVAQPSEVLLAMGRSLSDASACLRFSFGWSTTSADVESLLAALPALVGQARGAFA